jgi:NAD(P)-dependent dehydrogenase (short-subunit alcohol dehydrogenase family)
MKLRDRVAIVTGGGGAGSGRAIARRLAREGATTVVADIDRVGGEETSRLIGSNGGISSFVFTDVSVESDVRQLVAAAKKQFGRLDILVNDASGAQFPESTLDHWFANIKVDLLGAMYATRYAVEQMQQTGGGAIVNLGSVSALCHGGRISKAPGYDTAKAGIVRLTTSLGPLLKSQGIRINCLVPGWIASPPVKNYWETLSAQERKTAGVPDVLINPDDVADAIVRLICDDSLSGRVLVWWNGEPPRLIPLGDPGYAALA